MISALLSEAGRHPSLTVFLSTALSRLSQQIAREPHVAAKVIPENVKEMTPISGLSFEYHPNFSFSLTVVLLHSPEQLESDISALLAQH